VVPLTGTAKDKDKDNDSDKLLGAAGSSPTLGDAIATKVLAKGETIAAPPGRADNFAWTNGSQTKSAVPETPVADQPKLEAPVAAQPKAAPEVTGALASAPADMKQQERKKGSAGKLTQQKPAKNSTPPQVTAPTQPQDDVPRPPMPIGSSGSPLGPRR
jgi:cell division protein FtsN